MHKGRREAAWEAVGLFETGYDLGVEAFDVGRGERRDAEGVGDAGFDGCA